MGRSTRSVNGVLNRVISRERAQNITIMSFLERFGMNNNLAYCAHLGLEKS